MNKPPYQSTSNIGDAQLDTLLEQRILRPPDNFVAQVMTVVDEQDKQPMYANDAGNEQQLTWWQWLSLLLAGAPGMAQAFALVFSAWHISSAG